jgi:hypothetical protein
MDKTLISGLFGHFHMEVNSEMIPNLSRWAAESLKIETIITIFIFSTNRFFSKNRNKFSKIKNKFFK